MWRALLCVSAAVAASACTKANDDGQAGSAPAEAKGSEASAPPPPAPSVATRAGDADGSPTKPAPELMPDARERRLHPDRATSSSFLWNDWNRFQENYHPLYLIDDDPGTAWVEGADGPGSGQWVRLHTTEVAATTRVRLKLRNGYHKSKSLFAKNARAKRVTVTLSPSGTSASFDLPDEMTWKELSLEQAEGPLDAIEIRVDEVYPGTKYADLCLSDVEVHATSRMAENPTFEKDKLARVKAWKKERVETARYFASEEAKAAPIGAAYRVSGVRVLDVPITRSNRPILDGLARATGELAPKEAVTRARSSIASQWKDWRAMRVSAKESRAMPEVDGLYTPDVYEVASSGTNRSDAYKLPITDQMGFLRTSMLASFEDANKVSVAEALDSLPSACNKQDGAHHIYFQPPRKTEGRDGIDELLVIQCGQVSERDGYYPFAEWQLLEYDQAGRLVLAVDAFAATAFEWSTDGQPRITGGSRVQIDWNGKLSVDRLTAQTPP